MRTKKQPVPKLSEKQIENSILQYLHLKKIYCWKQNTTGVYDAQKECFRRPHSPYIISGIADIIGIMPSGRFFAIEVKTPQRKSNVSDHQKAFLQSIQESGGIAFIATSIEDVINNLQD
jgi:penicillin-binding protein-related factor A (putative recombinase)